MSSLGYFVVLTLDAIIGLALYIVLKHSNKVFAFLTSTLRLIYSTILIIGLFLLVANAIVAFNYATIKLIGYIAFALHIFTLGYSVFQSGYIPKSLGVLLIIASLAYIVFFVNINLPELLEVTLMSTMAIAELSLSIWLIVKRNHLPDRR